MAYFVCCGQEKDCEKLANSINLLQLCTNENIENRKYYFVFSLKIGSATSCFH